MGVLEGKSGWVVAVCAVCALVFNVATWEFLLAFLSYEIPMILALMLCIFTAAVVAQSAAREVSQEEEK